MKAIASIAAPVAIVSLMTVPGCATKGGDAAVKPSATSPAADTGAPDRDEILAQAAAGDRALRNALTVDFAPGDAALEDTEAARIVALTRERSAKGLADVVYIGAWSDPSASTPVDGAHGAQVAQERIQTLESALRAADFKGNIVAVNLGAEPRRVQEVGPNESTAIEVREPLRDARGLDSRYQEVVHEMQTYGGEGQGVVIVGES